MDKLIFGIGIFVIAWCVFAFFDFKKENDVLRVYGLSETGERTSSIDGSTLPKYKTQAVVEYRISQGKVMEKLGTSIDEYDNCKIFDIKNFTCTYSDDSATFGAKDGLYFERNNVEKFPHLADPLFNEMFGVTRFRYITTECQWWFTDDFINAVVGCALEPFTL